MGDLNSMLLNRSEYSTVLECLVCGSPELEFVGNTFTIDTRSSFNVTIKKCQHCGHWMTDPMPSANLLAHLYRESSPAVLGENASDYQVSVQDRNISQKMAPDSNWIVNSLSEIEPSSVLEVGCGDGNLLRKFRSLGWDAYGVDMGTYAAGPQVVSSRQQLPTNKSFNVLVFQDVLEHLSDPKKELSEYMTLLAPNALLFIAVPWSESKRAQLAKTGWEMVRPLGHLHYFSTKSASLLFEAVGCAVHSWKVTNPFRYYPEDPDDLGDQLYMIGYRK